MGRTYSFVGGYHLHTQCIKQFALFTQVVGFEAGRLGRYQRLQFVTNSACPKPDISETSATTRICYTKLPVIQQKRNRRDRTWKLGRNERRYPTSSETVRMIVLPLGLIQVSPPSQFVRLLGRNESARLCGCGPLDPARRITSCQSV